VWEVANQRVHGTTQEQVSARWKIEAAKLQPIDGRPPYPYVEQELRKVARDAYVAWEGNRYSVPWRYAGRQVWVRGRSGQMEVHYGGQCIASHIAASGKHQTITQAEHHREIPLGGASGERKTLVHLRQTAPVVQIRPLSAYEALAGGGR
jgi:hypothetical protein